MFRTEKPTKNILSSQKYIQSGVIRELKDGSGKSTVPEQHLFVFFILPTPFIWGVLTDGSLGMFHLSVNLVSIIIMNTFSSKNRAGEGFAYNSVRTQEAPNRIQNHGYQ